MSWFTLTLLSQLFLVSYYFFSKRLLNKKEIDPRLYGACLQLATGVIALPFALWNGLSFELTTTSVLLMVGMAITYTIGPSLYYVGLKHADLSETTILDSSGVLWSVVFGLVLLGESFSLAKISGVALVVLSVLVVSFNHTFMKFHLNRFEALLLVSPLFYALGAVFDSSLVKYSDALSYTTLSFLLAGSFMFLSNVPRLKSIGKTTLFNTSFLKTIALNGIFLFLTYWCLMTAYQRGGEVSSIFPLQQIESVVVPLLGIVFLRERKRVVQKVLAAIIASAGVLLLR